MEYKICDDSVCVGCALCADVCPCGAITAEQDRFGFIRPKIDPALCVSCGKCTSLCPAVETVRGNGALSVFASYALDKDVRKKSSSGGVFRLLADDTLASGGVVAAVGFDPSFHAVYKIADNSGALDELMGSKYTEARADGIYKTVKDILSGGRRVLFVGTPCRAAAMKNYVGECENLLTVDFICHGVPTGRLLEKYLEGFSNIRYISFRDKKRGWDEFSMRIDSDNPSSRSLYSDPYLRIFLDNAALRDSCYDCRFKKDGYRSDITLGDYWGLFSKIPSMNDDRGTSAVVIRTKAGEAAFSRIKEKMKNVVSTESDLIALNPAIVNSSHPHPERQTFLNMIERDAPFDEIASSFGVPLSRKAILTKRFKQTAKRFFSTIKKKP